jgi:hypothetical protein
MPTMKTLRIPKKTHQSASLLILIKIKVEMKLSRWFHNKVWRSSMEEVRLKQQIISRELMENLCQQIK